MIKKAFEITKNNMIVAQPLVIFMIIISVTLAGLAQQTNHLTYGVVLTANILLCTAFFAGWFYMIKKVIEHTKKADKGEYKDDEEKTAASFALIKQFFPGVGEYFMSMTFTIIAYLAVYALLIFVCIKLGYRFLPDPSADLKNLMTAASGTPAEIQKFVLSLSLEQLKTLNYWMMYMGTVSSLFTILTMFLFPAVYDTDKEGKKDFVLYAPFAAFNRNLVFIARNLVGVLGIVIFLFALNIILSGLSILFNLNVILSIVGLIISFYFMTYAIILIFLYYEEKK